MEIAEIVKYYNDSTAFLETQIAAFHPSSDRRPNYFQEPKEEIEVNAWEHLDKALKDVYSDVIPQAIAYLDTVVKPLLDELLSATESLQVDNANEAIGDQSVSCLYQLEHVHEVDSNAETVIAQMAKIGEVFNNKLLELGKQKKLTGDDLRILVMDFECAWVQALAPLEARIKELRNEPVTDECAVPRLTGWEVNSWAASKTEGREAVDGVVENEATARALYNKAMLGLPSTGTNNSNAWELLTVEERKAYVQGVEELMGYVKTTLNPQLKELLKKTRTLLSKGSTVGVSETAYNTTIGQPDSGVLLGKLYVSSSYDRNYEDTVYAGLERAAADFVDECRRVEDGLGMKLGLQYVMQPGWRKSIQKVLERIGEAREARRGYKEYQRSDYEKTTGRRVGDSKSIDLEEGVETEILHREGGPEQALEEGFDGFAEKEFGDRSGFGGRGRRSRR